MAKIFAKIVSLLLISFSLVPLCAKAATAASKGGSRLIKSAAIVKNETLALPLVPERVVAGLDVDRTFKSYGWRWSYECPNDNLKNPDGSDIVNGSNGKTGETGGALVVPEEGLSYREERRFGKSIDPLNPQGKRVFLLSAGKDDPVISGGRRCEITFSPDLSAALPLGEYFWFGFGIHLPSWQASQGEQILAQWHHADGYHALNPFFAISVSNESLWIAARKNTVVSPDSTPETGTMVTKDTQVDLFRYESPGLPRTEWTYFVVRAKITQNLNNAQPTVQVWKDGVLLASSHDAFGYNISKWRPFAKLGLYHWVSGNSWPSNIGQRSMLMRSPIFVLDANGEFSESAIRAYIKAH